MELYQDKVYEIKEIMQNILFTENNNIPFEEIVIFILLNYGFSILFLIVILNDRYNQHFLMYLSYFILIFID